MKLSTRSRYGVRMMADLADCYGKSPVFLKDIAKKGDVSGKYLSIILIPLRAARLIQSIRGSHGGYVLARPPEKITVGDIIDGLVNCVKNPQDCSRASTCPTRDVWTILSEKIRETLAAIILDDLVRKRREKAENNIMSNI